MIGFIAGFDFVVKGGLWLKVRISIPHLLASNEQKQARWFFTSQSYELNSNKQVFHSKSCDFLCFSSSPTRLSLLLIDEKGFCSSLKSVLLIDEKLFAHWWKRGRGFVFALAKNGNECDLKILPSSSSFLNLFSLTPIGVLFVCSFVCLFTRARGSIRKVFICITLQHLFLTQKNAVFATQFALCFCTQFLHHFAYISGTILTAFLMQIGVLFWYFFEYQFAVEIHRYLLQKSSNYLPQNDTLFAIKRYVIFSKTSRRFQQNDSLFFE